MKTVKQLVDHVLQLKNAIKNYEETIKEILDDLGYSFSDRNEFDEGRYLPDEVEQRSPSAWLLREALVNAEAELDELEKQPVLTGDEAKVSPTFIEFAALVEKNKHSTYMRSIEIWEKIDYETDRLADAAGEEDFCKAMNAAAAITALALIAADPERIKWENEAIGMESTL